MKLLQDYLYCLKNFKLFEQIKKVTAAKFTGYILPILLLLDRDILLA